MHQKNVIDVVLVNLLTWDRLLTDFFIWHIAIVDFEQTNACWGCDIIKTHGNLDNS